MEDRTDIATLPPARNVEAALARRLRDRRFIAFVVLAIVAIVLLVTAKNALFHHAPAPADATPADAFRPTEAQLRELKIAPVAFGANAEIVRATGSIQADADHSTPILLPFSGQVLQVMVEPGQRVAAGRCCGSPRRSWSTPAIR